MVKFNKLEITSDGSSLLLDVAVKDDYYYRDVYLDSIYIDSLTTYSGDIIPSEKAVKIEVDTIDIDGKKYYPIVATKVEDTTIIKYKLPFQAEEIGKYAINLDEEHLITNPNRDVIMVDSDDREFNIGAFYNNFDTGYKWIMKYIPGDSPTLSPVKKWNSNDPNVFDSKKSFITSLSVKDLLLLLDSSSDNNPLFVVYAKTKGIPSPDTPCGFDSEYTMGVAINKCPILNYILETANSLDDSCAIPKDFINGILQYRAFILAIQTGKHSTAIKYWKRFYNDSTLNTAVKNCGCHGI